MDWTVPWELVGRVLVAGLLGAAVGFDREVREHSAGLRTHALVAVGAALFGVVSIDGFTEIAAPRALTNMQADVTRVASQVVVGIGFLGAGVIFRRGDSVRNLTTAASLWATAALGLAAGVGDVGLAVVAAVVLIVVLAREGAVAHEVVVVVEGEVRLERAGRPAGRLGPGGSFGGHEVLTGAPHRYTVLAGGGVELRVVEAPAFLAAADRLPLLAAPLRPAC